MVSVWTQSVIFSMLYAMSVFFVSAQVQITEIMYNPEGSDLQQEWIELQNTSEELVNLTRYGVRDASTTRHSIVGPPALVPGEIAIVASDRDLFGQTYPSYPGRIYTSALSLRNSGQNTVSLLNESDGSVHTVAYSTLLGGDGNGNSLHITASGTVISGSPSPGYITDTVEDPSDGRPGEKTIEEVPALSKGTLTIVTPAVILAGVAQPYRAELSGERVHARVWNFGDGTTIKRSTPSHTYKYPGTYRITVTAPFLKKDRTTIKTITAVTPAIALSTTPASNNRSAVTLQNNHDGDIDISGWRIVFSTYQYTVPAGTYLVAKSTLTLAPNIPYNPNIPLIIQDSEAKTIAVLPTPAPSSEKTALTERVAGERATEASDTVLEALSEYREQLDTHRVTDLPVPDTDTDTRSVGSWRGALLVLLVVLLLPFIILLVLMQKNAKK